MADPTLGYGRRIDRRSLSRMIRDQRKLEDAAAFQQRQDEQGTSAPHPDSDTLGGGITPDREWAAKFRRNPQAEQDAYAAVAGSRIGRNVNTINARTSGAIAASPPAFMPDSRRFVFPDIPRTASGSPAVAPDNVESLLGYGRTPTSYRGATNTNDAGARRYFDARASLAPKPIGTEISTESAVAAGLDRPPEVETGTDPMNRGITSISGTAKVRPVSWQEQVVAKHPATHEAGTPENTEFVKRYKAAIAQGQQIDPMTLADTVAKEIATANAARKKAMASTAGIPGGSPADYAALDRKAPALRFNSRS